MQTVNVCSLAAEGENKLSAHFRVREFACADGSDPVFVSPRLVEVLEAVRQHFGAPVHVNSGYRTVSYNASLKNSSPKSQHCSGLAADFWVEGAAPAEVCAVADSLLGDHGGIGLYDSFVHIDVRAGKARWKG